MGALSDIRSVRLATMDGNAYHMGRTYWVEAPPNLPQYDILLVAAVDLVALFGILRARPDNFTHARGIRYAGPSIQYAGPIPIPSILLTHSSQRSARNRSTELREMSFIPFIRVVREIDEPDFAEWVREIRKQHYKHGAANTVCFARSSTNNGHAMKTRTESRDTCPGSRIRSTTNEQQTEARYHNNRLITSEDDDPNPTSGFPDLGPPKISKNTVIRTRTNKLKEQHLHCTTLHRHNTDTDTDIKHTTDTSQNDNNRQPLCLRRGWRGEGSRLEKLSCEKLYTCSARLLVSLRPLRSPVICRRDDTVPRTPATLADYLCAAEGHQILTLFWGGGVEVMELGLIAAATFAGVKAALRWVDLIRNRRAGSAGASCGGDNVIEELSQKYRDECLQHSRAIAKVATGFNGLFTATHLPAKANRVRFPAEQLPDFRMWESCRTMPPVGGFPRGSPVSPALAFRRGFFYSHRFTLIGSRDLDVKRRSISLHSGGRICRQSNNTGATSQLKKEKSILQITRKLPYIHTLSNDNCRNGGSKQNDCLPCRACGVLLLAISIHRLSLPVGCAPVGTPGPRSRSEGAIRATLTRTPSASSLLRARRAVLPSYAYSRDVVCRVPTRRLGKCRALAVRPHLLVPRDVTNSLPLLWRQQADAGARRVTSLQVIDTLQSKRVPSATCVLGASPLSREWPQYIQFLPGSTLVTSFCCVRRVCTALGKHQLTLQHFTTRHW
ncbi:hypothetical protein PR048_033501 [Dryococelus australis]|uniref:Uncharacterized protein n=1 Tax=Dryococelus australis TaxID=614101 RepID=A0ABQ9G3J5_9NEOP|nr:hypothetical protein PR048_033501 [Dryococelus australis]